MKRCLMIPALLITFQSSAFAATEAGFSDLQFVLLVAVNLLIGGLLLFCCLVIGAALLDRYRANRKSIEPQPIEQPRSSRQPKPSQHRQHRPAAKGALATGQ